MTKNQAKKEASQMINNALSNADASKGCVRKALALIGKDDSGHTIVSTKGRAKLASLADQLIDACPTSQAVYDLSYCHRSAQACLVMARKSGFLIF